MKHSENVVRNEQAAWENESHGNRALHVVREDAPLSGPERALANARAKVAQVRNDNDGRVVPFAQPQVKKAVIALPSATGLLGWLSHFAGLRHRYFFTRQNKLRLRYVVPPVACALMAVTALSGLPAHIHGAASDGYSAVVASLSGDSVRDDFDPAAAHMSASQKRLSRYAAQSLAHLEDRAVQELAELKEVLQPKQEEMAVRSGDTLSGVLQRAGVAAAESLEIVKALEAHYDPRHLKAGQKLFIRFDPAADGQNYDFAGLDMPLDPIKSVSLEKDREGSFKSAVLEKEVETKVYSGQVTIENSLYGSAAKAGIPSGVTSEAIKMYSYDIDFQREIQRGDSMDVLYERVETEDGDFVESGNVLFARLKVGGQEIPLYRYEIDGIADYYSPDGKSVRKALMKTPIDGARISSGFGMRRHPVLGYSKMHKGVDFAAPTGTPIYAAGDGTIEMAQRFSSYGNYVRIRHANSMKTAYAHLSKFGKDMKPGKRVKQGEIIGYVGSTGRSTGPHLHYEVMQNGVQINPNNLKIQQKEPLKGKQLDAFKAHVAKINSQYEKLAGGGRLAWLTD